MYASLVDGAYDCVDRIVLNAYFRFAQSPAGFRVWWRQLYGTDDNLDNAHLMRMAGRFRRRLRAWALANNISVRSCRHGEQKHEIAEQYREQTSIQEGLFLILEGRAQAPVWDVLNSGRIQHKIPYPYVNHYSFHIPDRDWGHVTIKISGHPPFPAQIILNGHEYVEREATKAGIACKKEGNCFSRISDAEAFAAIAETLTAESVTGRLTAVCDRWIYKICLCFALDREERQRSRFRYQYSTYQLEYSRNLLFRKGSQMQQVVETLVDRNRTRMNVKRLKTILGRKNRPHHRKKKSAQWQITIERPSYDLTIFKVYCGKMALKIYTKGERVLRAEAMAIDARELRCGRDVGQFAKTATNSRRSWSVFWKHSAAWITASCQPTGWKSCHRPRRPAQRESAALISTALECVGWPEPYSLCQCDTEASRLLNWPGMCEGRVVAWILNTDRGKPLMICRSSEPRSWSARSKAVGDMKHCRLD
jgi:hypothetical protein